MYNCDNMNNFCRVCFKKRPETEMLSVNQSQMDKLLFIGDSNKVSKYREKIFRFNFDFECDSFINGMRFNETNYNTLTTNKCSKNSLHFQIIRFNAESPKLCIECGVNLDSVYDFIVKLRMNTLKKEQRKQLDHSNSPNIEREVA